MSSSKVLCSATCRQYYRGSSSCCHYGVDLDDALWNRRKILLQIFFQCSLCSNKISLREKIRWWQFDYGSRVRVPCLMSSLSPTSWMSKITFFGRRLQQLTGEKKRTISKIFLNRGGIPVFDLRHGKKNESVILVRRNNLQTVFRYFNIFFNVTATLSTIEKNTIHTPFTSLFNSFQRIFFFFKYRIPERTDFKFPYVINHKHTF